MRWPNVSRRRGEHECSRAIIAPPRVGGSTARGARARSGRCDHTGGAAEHSCSMERRVTARTDSPCVGAAREQSSAGVYRPRRQHTCMACRPRHRRPQRSRARPADQRSTARRCVGSSANDCGAAYGQRIRSTACSDACNIGRPGRSSSTSSNVLDACVRVFAVVGRCASAAAAAGTRARAFERFGVLVRFSAAAAATSTATAVPASAKGGAGASGTTISVLLRVTEPICRFGGGRADGTRTATSTIFGPSTRFSSSSSSQSTVSMFHHRACRQRLWPGAL